MGVSKHFAPWAIFWSYFEVVEPFCPLGVLKHFEPKIHKDFELYQIFIYV